VRSVTKIGVLVLFSVFSSALVGMPASASPTSPASAPLGFVMQAANPQYGVDVPSSGATVYDGDRLQTGAGTLRVRLGGPQMYMSENTTAQVHGLPKGFSADLGAGSVVVSSTQGQNFQLVADGVSIRPADAQGAVAQVTRVNSNELLLSSTRGSIEVSMGDESKTIEAGSSYRVEVEPEDASPQGGPVHTGHSHRLLFYTIVAGIAVGTAILIWRATESPSGF
jgi:hypothetical protein